MSTTILNNTKVLSSMMDSAANGLETRDFSYLITTFIILFILYCFHGTKANSPLLNPKKPFELFDYRAKKEFVLNAREMIKQGFQKTGNKPFRLIADAGVVTILPPEFAHEVRNDKRLSFSKQIFRTFHAHIPGFEGFREGTRDSHLVKYVAQRQLTTALNKVTEPLSTECALSLQDIFTDNEEWHEITLKTEMLLMIARMSSKVFLGDELCHNERWLRVTINYTVTAFKAAEILRMFPYYLRGLVHWFLPACRSARELVKEARQVIRPVLDKRRAQRAALIAQGKVAQFNDAIDWFEQTANGSYYDPAIAQLVISLAAIHTTTDLVTTVLYDLAQHPEFIELLRQEITEVLGETGWKKISLYNLKLLDSVIKESQRMKPIGSASMRRVATEDVKLSDGTIIPKSSMMIVSSKRMWDPEVHKDPTEWNGYRFYNMRNVPGKENTAQLVSTSPDHLAFGHGAHACPGRFFAANEVKIFLCHFLLKYDFKMVEGQQPRVTSFGLSMMADPTVKMMIRRRKEEINLAALEV